MSDWFNKAFVAVQKGFSYSQQKLSEVLPTPGKRPAKRKRDDHAALQDDAEPANVRARRDVDENQKLERMDSIEPSSQFARAKQAPLDLSRTTSTAGILRTSIEPRRLIPPDIEKASGAAVIPENTQQPLKTNYRPPWQASASKRESSVPRQSSFLLDNLMKDEGKQDPVQNSKLLPWQRNYINRMQRNNGFSFGAAVRSNDTAQEMRWAPNKPFASRRLNQFASKQQDLKEIEEYRRMTQDTMRHAPIFAGVRKDRRVIDLDTYPSQSSGSQDMHRGAKPMDVDDGSTLRSDPGQSILVDTNARDQQNAISPEEMVARHERHRRKAEIDEELKQRERERRLQRSREHCNRLMGPTQAELLARVSLALGERSLPVANQAPRNAAAEISRASMQVAAQEGKMLKEDLAGITLHEEQKETLAKRRKAQLAAQEEAQSVARASKPTKYWQSPARSPLKERTHVNGTAKYVQSPVKKFQRAVRDIPKAPEPKKPDDDVVELLSSDDEDERPPSFEQASEDEDGLQENGVLGEEYTEEDDDSAEEDDEEGLSRKFRGIQVNHQRVTPGFPRLTKKQYALYKDALNESANQDKEMFLHKGSNIGVTRALMMCLKPRTWLNDEVMNLTISLLLERDKNWRLEGKSYPKCHFFNTFFFNKLYLDKQKYDYSQVQRWTTAKKLKPSLQLSTSILDCDRIIAPVHLGCHWTCAMADLKNKEFSYYDSMLDANSTIMECLVQYVADEYKDKRKEDVDTHNWPIRYRSDIPRQMNGCDCGVFALMFAEHLARDAPLNFDQSDMPYFRVMLAAAIMDQKLISEFEEEE